MMPIEQDLKRRFPPAAARTRRVIATTALALVLVGVMGLQVNRAEQGHAPLRVMSFNIKAYVAGDKPGGRRGDPFKDEKPLFSIDAKNAAQYADKLSDGAQALLPADPRRSDHRVDQEGQRAGHPHP